MENTGLISRAEHEEFVRRMDAENDRQNHRIDVLEKTVEQIHALAISVEKLAQSVESMAKVQEEQGERLKAIENRDGELWRNIVSHAVMLIAGAVVSYFLARAGFN